MTKPLKVTHAVCPCCHFRKPLEDSGHYVRHFLLGCKLPSGEIVNCIGEELDDIERDGGFYGNPFELNVAVSIEYNSKN